MPDCPATLEQRMARKPDTRLADRARAARDREREKTEAQRIRSSARWQRLRGLIRSRQPLCADPFRTHATEGRIEPATEVHHIAPVWQRPELAFAMSNLMPVCRDCHERLEPKA